MKQYLVNKFNVSQADINYYKNKKFNCLDNIKMENFGKGQKLDIEVNKIAGTTRVDIDVKTFEEFIDTFHKEHLLDKSIEDLSKIISKPNNGYPEIYFYNDEYYLCGDGKHRIIIALLIGISKMPVIVYKD